MKEQIKRIMSWGLVVLLVLGGLLLISVSMAKVGENEADYSYKISRDLDYKVRLVDNYFYDTMTLSDQDSYPANLIDKISIDYDYNYTGSKSSKYTYRYSVTAVLTGTYEDKEVWTREFELVPKTSAESITGNRLKITSSVDVDYQYYRSLVKQYAQENNLSIKANLAVKLNVFGDNKIDGIKNVKTINDSVVANISINNLTAEVDKVSTEVSTDNIFADDKSGDKSVLDYALTILGAVLIVVAAGLVYFKIRKTNVTNKELYRRNIQHVLKDYSELIVTVNNRPKIDSLNKMKLNSIADLIDAAEQNKTNIVHYETYTDKKSTLYVIAGKYVYTYVITHEKIQ